jgi:fructose-bisphosphate aldolase class II
MPIAIPRGLRRDARRRAKAGKFAYPAINCTSSQTSSIAALRGFAEAGSDGIIQVSTGGAEFASGSTSRTW